MTNEEIMKKWKEILPENFNLEHLPRPRNYHILVLPEQPEEKTKGGIIKVSITQKAEKFNKCTGVLVRKGDRFGTDRDGKPCFNGHDPEVGDVIVYSKFEGQTLIVNGVHFLIMNDDSILATLHPDSDYKTHTDEAVSYGLE